MSNARSYTTDPYMAFNFLIEIQGLTVGGFTEVTGLQAEIELQDYREGGVNDYIHRLAGPTRYPNNLVLKHGLTDSETLWQWYADVTQGIVERRNGSIVLKDASGEPKRRWDFQAAYPVRWIGPQFRAGASEVAVETVELVHHGLRNVPV